MQFTFATLAVMATAVLATAPDSTIYQTEEVTITSCAPTVTDCPAHSTVVSLTSYPVTTTAEEKPLTTAAPSPTEEAEETLTSFTTIVNTITSCHPTVTNCPIGKVTTITVPHSTTKAAAATTPVVPVVPVTTEKPIAPKPTVPAPPVTITISSCPAVVPTWTSVHIGPTAPAVATISGFPKPSNGTIVTPPVVTSPPITGAASAVSGSIFAVGFAAIVAVFFA
ncbi:hypothetical protein VC83_08171 [Pseudogymnoascus destructans]|uniref:GPI anchored serine-rich protein n=2 Tax=Pseudogymnoascus destructans TaxID=655981 RepID=L8FYM8_PSED2|nr:uncharacterized protein VC83_08171 [Pseudogymnoascus destructans]ELR05977.1 hypothetical protein GMDG_01938 [Pseudogymnoascus destructans 20631-21]OAF55224.1 hypothetical protein VC83_08171 [Pseudogymnoascus destructans]